MFENILNFVNFGAAGGTAPTATAPTTTGAAASGGFGSIWFIVILFILMYVMLILPQKRQEKKHKQMLSQIKKGDKILTSSGIIGKVVSVSSDKIRIRTAEKTELDITKNAVGAVMSKAAEDTKKDDVKEGK